MFIDNEKVPTYDKMRRAVASYLATNTVSFIVDNKLPVKQLTPQHLMMAMEAGYFMGMLDLARGSDSNDTCEFSKNLVRLFAPLYAEVKAAIGEEQDETPPQDPSRN